MRETELKWSPEQLILLENQYVEQRRNFGIAIKNAGTKMAKRPIFSKFEVSYLQKKLQDIRWAVHDMVEKIFELLSIMQRAAKIALKMLGFLDKFHCTNQ